MGGSKEYREMRGNPSVGGGQGLFECSPLSVSFSIIDGALFSITYGRNISFYQSLQEKQTF